MQTTKRYFKIFVYLGSCLLLFVFTNACEILSKEGLHAPEVLAQKSQAIDDNGRTYDGKLIVYQSRQKVTCDNRSTAEITIENDKILNSFRILKNVPSSNGTCYEEIEQNASVEAFEVSHLAAYDGKINDKVLQLGEVLLDNSHTQIVCKMRPITLLDNMLSGAVVMDTPQPLLWASRLDFLQRSEKTKFMFDRPPPGQLVQTRTSLEFRTAMASTLVSPGIYQLLHIKISRSYDQAMSPSLDYGKKIYDGTFQYFYADYNQSPVFGVSLGAMPATCFVNNIDLSRVHIDLDSNYDFTQSVIEMIQH